MDATNTEPKATEAAPEVPTTPEGFSERVRAARERMIANIKAGKKFLTPPPRRVQEDQYKKNIKDRLLRDKKRKAEKKARRKQRGR